MEKLELSWNFKIVEKSEFHGILVKIPVEFQEKFFDFS